ncbi:carboxypeptidase regulatory-like domain-containing protein, partial [Ralstonia pickettii]|nr:carboxypeptidase regulatory-like domain-containing protein [Ralstonia pickettii]
VSPDVQLTPLPRQTISGEITNGSGEPIDDVTVFLLEDEKAPPVQSAEDGSYSLHAYPGNYTLKVFANGYKGISETVEVKADEAITLDLNLMAFNHTETSEIKYDNGNYGRNLAFGKKGNGFAVKMSLEEGEASALVTGAKLQFWAEHVPVPGGDDILISVYDANGENGAPGHKLAGPIEAKAARDLSKWTEVDLSDLGIVVDDDFYIVYLQADDYPYIPGFVTDGDSANYAERSWDYIGGQWFEANQRTGNYMIRAEVDYGDEAEVVAPVITSPESGLLTNEAEVTVVGTAQASTTLQLLNNGEEVYRSEVGNDGEFSIPVALDEGENELLAISLMNDEAIAESEKVTVELDTKEPELTIVSPQDGDTIDSKQVIVEGNVRDKHLERVEVNGEEASVDENGSYTAELTLSEGEQNISVQAFDRAGNASREEITIYIDLGEDAFTIENITPFEDVYLRAGESVEIAFDSEPGLKASYRIHIPIEGDTPEVVPPLELPMMEVGNGHYVGYWTAPRSIVIDSGARIEIKARDSLKNEVTQTADGKLFINVGE